MLTSLHRIKGGGEIHLLTPKQREKIQEAAQEAVELVVYVSIHKG